MVIKAMIRSLLVAGFVIGASAAGNAKDAPKTLTGADGAMLANTCAGCHGTNGASVGPGSPTIAGISKDYFVELMKGFKSGAIPGTIMKRIADGYNDDEINAMADHFSKLKFVNAKQEFDAKKAATGKKVHDKFCEKCHENGGTHVEDDTGRLAGQWMPYLHNTMSDFRSGKREMPKKMRKKVEALNDKYGDKAFDALNHYYASQQ